MYNLDPKIKMF